jgi:hypothetical protein
LLALDAAAFATLAAVVAMFVAAPAAFEAL